MPETEFEKKIYAEIRKIETDRFDEGLRIRRDPREDRDYDLEWALSNNPAIFQENWAKSLCKSCINWKECGFKCASDCKFYRAS